MTDFEIKTNIRYIKKLKSERLKFESTFLKLRKQEINYLLVLLKNVRRQYFLHSTKVACEISLNKIKLIFNSERVRIEKNELEVSI